MPPAFRDLLLRFNQLGAMLPRDLDYLDEDEPDHDRLDAVMLILAEMEKVEAQTIAYLDGYRQR